MLDYVVEGKRQAEADTLLCPISCDAAAARGGSLACLSKALVCCLDIMADLPALAIECIALHLTRSSAQHAGSPNPARIVLPLVSKTWRCALQLAPAELWEQVSICTADLFPEITGTETRPSSQASHSQQRTEDRPSAGAVLSRWFAARQGQVRRLAINLSLATGLCRLPELERALSGVLASCGASLEALHLEVDGAPRLAGRLWRHFVELTAGAGCKGSQLRELSLCLEGRPGCGECSATWLALQELELVSLQRGLERLSIRLRGIKLLGLPASLESLPALTSLALHFDPAAPTLPLPSAASFARGLPPTLHSLELWQPPLQQEAALALPAKLPLLERFVLVF
ncbi:hypothetical protein ABPG75_013790 [Micractinium tetrahymenae]